MCPQSLASLALTSRLRLTPSSRGPYGKGAVGLRRYAHHEFAAVGAVRHRFRRLFTVGLHIRDALSHQLPNPGKGVLWKDASQLNRGNSAHSPTNSPSSADQVTL